jgi:hypothetical protein
VLLSLSQFSDREKGKERKKKPLVIKRKTALAISIHGEKTPPAALSSLLRDVDDDPCFSFQFLLVAYIHNESCYMHQLCFFSNSWRDPHLGGFTCCLLHKTSKCVLGQLLVCPKETKESVVVVVFVEWLSLSIVDVLARSLAVRSLSQSVSMPQEGEK